MEIISATPQPRQFRLRRAFLEPYMKQGDPFKSLLARSTYLSKYSRNGEVWTDTIKRVVEGNMSLTGNASEQEAERLFHLFWTGQTLPPGRGLWVGGVEGIPADARFNCWWTTIYSIDDWCWTANQLMLGGGVGVGLQEIGNLPSVAPGTPRIAIWCKTEHPNYADVKPNDKSFLNGQTPVHVIPDSREGWVEALRLALTCAYTSRDIIMDVSAIRPRGQALKTFGGISCGPGPLSDLLRSVWQIVRGAAGRKINSVEALDITNYIGFCVKSGNVRRSALLVLGEPTDQAFRDAKKDYAKVKEFRHTSNNSIAFRTWDQIKQFDWASLVDDAAVLGEPGLLNLALVNATDPGAKGCNPCGEQALHDREACNLAEVFPAFVEGSMSEALRLTVRYCLRQRLTPLSDPQSQAVGERNMRVGVGLGGICDFDWDREQLAAWYRLVREESDSYADFLRVSRPLTTTTVKPSGTISLLNGSSPGIHAPYAPYYLRRIRLAVNDPMVPALFDAGVTWEHDLFDKTGNTLVFAFPTKAVHTRVTVQSENIRDQFERQVAVQEAWADNAVSATLSFNKETEREELAKCLKEFVPRCKSTTCMAKEHGYEQAPYEAIDETTFRTMYSKIQHGHPLVRGSSMEVDECVGGACPVR